MKYKKIIKRILITVIALAAATAVYAMIINAVIIGRGGEYIITEDELADIAASEKFDCILILGAGIRNDGSPSNMLEDRLKTGMNAYSLGASDIILASGDHSREGYDEVGAMQTYLTENGVNGDAVILDHAGFSTYESLYRAKEIFGVQRVLIITQKYHLYRALYTAEKLGLTAYGVSADLRGYRGEAYRQIREIFARNKDFLFTIFKPEPTYLGEKIPIK